MAYSTTGRAVIPYTLTTTIDGIEYETHVLTNTCQVITEDGITLCEVLKDLVTNDELKKILSDYKMSSSVYRYMGLLMNKPDKSAIDQLYEKVGMQDGEVYLVQRSNMQSSSMMTLTRNNAFDMYCWANAIHSWIFFGSTEKNSGPVNLPDSLQLFPKDLGSPGQTITISADGKSLEWAFPDETQGLQIESHNIDEASHPFILNQISTKADKLKIFNTVLNKCQWAWMDNAGYYSYVFTNDNIGPHAYFEITPIAFSRSQLDILQKAQIHPVYKIEDSELGSYAILHADHVPNTDIEVCVKVYGDFIDLDESK